MINLPYPTNTTENGPIIIAYGDNVLLRYDFYDYDLNNGESIWTKIKFREVLAYRYTQEICISNNKPQEFYDTVITEYNEMNEWEKTSWLSKIIDSWNSTVGSHINQINSGGKKRFKHYTISFDDEGIFEIICSSYEIHSKSNPE